MTATQSLTLDRKPGAETNCAHLRFRVAGAAAQSIADLQRAMAAAMDLWPYWWCAPKEMGKDRFLLVGGIRQLYPRPSFKLNYIIRPYNYAANYHYRALIVATPKGEAADIDCWIETFRPPFYWLLILVLAPFFAAIWGLLVFCLYFTGVLLSVAIAAPLIFIFVEKRKPGETLRDRCSRFLSLVWRWGFFPISALMGDAGRDHPERAFRRVFIERDRPKTSNWPETLLVLGGIGAALSG